MMVFPLSPPSSSLPPPLPHSSSSLTCSQNENPSSHAFEASLTHLRRSHGFEKVLFSCIAMKVHGI